MSAYSSYDRAEKANPAHDGPHICIHCEPRIVFGSRDKLMKHKAEKRIRNPDSHIHCQFCGLDFVNAGSEIYHIQQHHPSPQSLTCPACGQGPFVRASGLAKHIEQGRCTLKMHQIQAARDKKAEFATSLVKLTGAPLKNDFTDYMPTKHKLTTDERWGGWGDLEDALREAAQSPNDTDAWSVNTRERAFDEDFPQLGSTAGQVTNSVAPQAESIADSGAAVTESPTMAGENHSSSPQALPPHLRGSRTNAPASTTSDVYPAAIAPSATWNPSNLRGPQKTTPAAPPKDKTAANLEKAGKENAGTGWTPPHLRGPQPKPPVLAPAPDPSHFPKPNEKPIPPVPAWTAHKELFPGASAAQHPTRQQLEDATTPKVDVRTCLDSGHPGHPHWWAGRYWCEYNNAFMCPKPRCGKAFKNQQTLVGHLNGPAHGGTKHTCPSCHKTFHSLEATVAHSESPSSRCQLRHTEGFRAYMDQLTGGVVDVNFYSHGDGTHKYETSVKSMHQFGNKNMAEAAEEARKAEKEQMDMEVRQKTEFEKAKKREEEEKAQKASEFKAGIQALNAIKRK